MARERNVWIGEQSETLQIRPREYVWFKGPYFPEGLYEWQDWAGERRERIKTLEPVDHWYRVYEVDSSCLRPATPTEIILFGPKI